MKKQSPTIPSSIITLGALSLALFSGFGCVQREEEDKPLEPQVSASIVNLERRIAVAQLSPTEGSEVEGEVTFVEEAHGIRVIADVRNLTVDSKHGFHIHENGDCSAPDASSAGGHFNPGGHPHGGPDDEKRHVGDLGNLQTTESGGAMYVRVDSELSFDGESSIIGKSVIVHAGQDDLRSQPTGDAGPRLACGVIKWSD
ncbi:superoxide dismutase family protein [Pelagicoccus sp. SDUM812003]|uniref:superoxide dismutase family protein n=1 Tax=Pelagicoccus sp. SDUM812003 TaxID=3041267 RepID=UPI00280FF1BB|nr:superoxide dismutase family protein [Pelagicoccus sp. SDUM812003]MDQ8204002.1 superoxide dismutase family protein [Pelagicoccus sp. SDUM812003]